MANEKRAKASKNINKNSPDKHAPQPLGLTSPKSKDVKKREMKNLPSPSSGEEISNPPSPDDEAEKLDAELDWPKEHDIELFDRIRKNCPKDDTMKYDSRVNHLNWEMVKFRDYSAETCKNRWLFVQGHLRHYRLLTEVIDDAIAWTDHPWCNFNKGGKNNQKHPEQPKKPLTSYMLFYMEQKSSILEKQPGLSMTELSKVTAKMYRELSDRKKAKYVEMAEKEKETYNQKMQKFIEDHPEVNVSKGMKLPTLAKPLPPKLPTPFKLFCDSKMEKLIGDGLTPTEAREKCRDSYKELTPKQKLKWIYQAIEKESNYNEDMEKFKLEHPDYEFPSKKPSLLTKEEIQIKLKHEGKPEKPPNSGYSLYSKKLLSSSSLKHLDSKERMAEISRMWKELKDSEKQNYNATAQELLQAYKLRYATYLESLPPEKRELETGASSNKSIKRPGGDTTNKGEIKKVRSEEVDDSSDSNDESDEHQVKDAAKEVAVKPKKSAIQKPKSSLQMFCDMNASKYSTKHPGLSQQELTRLMAKDFVKLSPEKKKTYDNMAKKSKKTLSSETKKTTSEPSSPKITKVSAKKESDSVKATSKVKPSLNANLKAAKPAKSTKSPAIPAWAVGQRLYKNEPPKPPESAAAYYAQLNSPAGVPISDELVEEMWERVPEKQKKKITSEHKKKQQQYVYDFENFVRHLPTDELKDFRTFMKNRENEKKTAYEEDADDDDDEEDVDNLESSDEGANSSSAEQMSVSSIEEEALSSCSEDD